MVDKRTWDEFREAGLLWWVNRILHIFGWAIVVNLDDDDKVIEAYPARCEFRGFCEAGEAEGHKSLSRHIADNMDVISECGKEV